MSVKSRFLELLLSKFYNQLVTSVTKAQKCCSFDTIFSLQTFSLRNLRDYWFTPSITKIPSIDHRHVSKYKTVSYSS